MSNDNLKIDKNGIDIGNSNKNSKNLTPNAALNIVKNKIMELSKKRSMETQNKNS